MSIPKVFIDQVLEQTNIVDVIGRRLPLTKKGNNYWSLCPFHDDNYWKNLKKKYPNEFADAVALDKEIRTISRDKNIKNYTHRSCKPLDEVDFDREDNQLDMFENECEGVCMI